MSNVLKMPMQQERPGSTPIPSSELASLPTPSWLIEDVLPAESFAVLFGAPGEGKTFVAI